MRVADIAIGTADGIVAEILAPGGVRTVAAGAAGIRHENAGGLPRTICNDHNWPFRGYGRCRIFQLEQVGPIGYHIINGNCNGIIAGSR